MPNLIALFVLVVLFLVLVETIKHPRITVESISIPHELESNGYTFHGIANDLMVEIQRHLRLSAAYDSINRKQINPIVQQRGPFESDITFPAVGNSIKSIAKYIVSDLLPFIFPRRFTRPITVTGELFYSDLNRCLSLHLRLGRNKTVSITEKCNIKELLSDGADRVIESERDAVKEIYPCGLALFYFEKYRTRKESPFYKSRVDQLLNIISNTYPSNSPEAVCAANVQGMLYMVEKKYDLAMMELEEAIDIDSKYVWAHHNLALVHHFSGNNESAICKLREVIEIDPEYLRAYLTLGYILNKERRYYDANEIYEEAIAINPTYVQLYHNWAQTLKDDDKLDEAIEKYEEAVEIDPDNAKSRLYLAWALAEVAEYDRAFEQYERAVEIEPRNADAYHHWGHALAKRGYHWAAVKKYKRAIQLDRTNDHLYGHWGDQLARIGDCQGAMEKYRKAKELNQAFATTRFEFMCGTKPNLPL